LRRILPLSSKEIFVTATLEMPRLSKFEIDEFHNNGFSGPFAVCQPHEMASLWATIEEKVLPTPGVWKEHPEQLRHQDSRLVYDLCAHPEITGRLASLIGPDLLIWRSNFFVKEPGGKEVPWHQDVNYWKLDPPINLTAWLAFNEVTTENSCVQFIPGSQNKVVPHIKAGPEMHFAEMADPTSFDSGKAVNMILKPGEFFIFNERVLHHSDANRSNGRRLSMVIRYTVPFVKVPPLIPEHRMFMVSGEDRFGFNTLGQPPKA
jgi:hypothetical protein